MRSVLARILVEENIRVAAINDAQGWQLVREMYDGATTQGKRNKGESAFMNNWGTDNGWDWIGFKEFARDFSNWVSMKAIQLQGAMDTWQNQNGETITPSDDERVDWSHNAVLMGRQFFDSVMRNPGMLPRRGGPLHHYKIINKGQDPAFLAIARKSMGRPFTNLPGSPPNKRWVEDVAMGRGWADMTDDLRAKYLTENRIGPPRNIPARVSRSKFWEFYWYPSWSPNSHGKGNYQRFTPSGADVGLTLAVSWVPTSTSRKKSVLEEALRDAEQTFRAFRMRLDTVVDPRYKFTLEDVVAGKLRRKNYKGDLQLPHTTKVVSIPLIGDAAVDKATMQSMASSPIAP